MPWEPHPEAWARLERHLGPERFNAARQRMATVPRGATLIDNPVSVAPGFTIGNVHVMAGVPRIMQVMLDAVSPRLAKGRPMLARSIRLDVPEGDAAPGLAELQTVHPEVQIGSYPFFREGRTGANFVIRSTDPDELGRCVHALTEALRGAGQDVTQGGV